METPGNQLALATHRPKMSPFESALPETFGDDAGGSLRPVVTYVDGEYWEEALGANAFWPAVNAASDPYCDQTAASSPPDDGPESFSFDDYPGSEPPAPSKCRCTPVTAAALTSRRLSTESAKSTSIERASTPFPWETTRSVR